MTDKSKIIARECRFAVHVPTNKNRPDLHLVKERIHFDDGTSRPNLRWIKNFKRSFYVTLPQYRTYKQKKEVEELSHVMEYKCTQSDLRDKIAKALDLDYRNDRIKKLANSPYLYGSEITSTAIIKHLYQKNNTTHITPFSVLWLDIETDMINGTNDPIIITAVFENEIFIAVDEKFIKGLVDIELLLKSKAKEYISEYEDISSYQIHYYACINTVELIRKTFEWVHSKMPDFLAIWNMDFDIRVILETLEKYNVNPCDVLCDPSIPYEARICRYKQGPKKKRKASGQEVPIDYADQWHSLLLTASFYVIDAMCVYRLLRLAKQKEQYSLDAVLEKNLGARKLRFKEAEQYKKGAWHIFMQEKYKIEYMVYAMFDSLSMKLLDTKITDLSSVIPVFSGITDFAKINSKPRLIEDALHFFVLERGYVLNSVGENTDNHESNNIKTNVDENETIIDDDGYDTDDNIDTLSLRHWIVTLPAHMVVMGLPLVEESSKILTMIRAFVYDSDCVSAYPTCVSILNVSKSTTKRELIDIEGIPEDIFRLQNINLTSGYVNALEYSTTMFGFPSLSELDNN